MIRYFTEANSVEAVQARMNDATAPRLRQIMTALVRHLHALVKEVQLTQAEWEVAIDFLTRTGQMCSEERQEFILLSDVLGVSMLVDAIGNRRPPGATENTVLGPFHVEDAPVRAMGDSINLDGKGKSCLYTGRVIDLHGAPIAGARIDVWSDNAEGYYSVQQPGIQDLRDSRIWLSGDDEACGHGSEACPSCTHGFGSWRLVVAIPSAEAGDDPGEPGEGSRWVGVFLSRRFAFECGANGVGGRE
jgi:hypothetical protein